MRPPGVRSPAIAACGAVVAIALLTTACGGDPSAPLRGGLARVSVRTLGGDPDFDGYELVVDAERRLHIDSGVAVRLDDMSEGSHTITLENVADNCSVAGTQPRAITIAAGDSVDVAFDVACVATGISVTIRTSGTGNPPNYDLVGPSGTVAVPINGSTMIGRLQPGSYDLDLGTRVDQCTVTGGRRVTVDVRAREVTPVVFDVVCVPPVRPERIAFVFDSSLAGGIPDPWIALINPNGTGFVRLDPGTGPAWSPDGTILSYSDAQCVVYYSFDEVVCGGGLFTSDLETRTTIRQRNGGGGFSPAWSPARDAIAFVTCCNLREEPEPDRLVVLDVRGAANTIAPVQLSAVLAADHPTWSPDGQRIAFACMVESSNWDICVVNRNGTGFTRLTTDPRPDVQPAWSPDGTHIAFAAAADVALLRVDDRTVSTLTVGSWPAWSPDGIRLVFARKDGLFTMSADGSNVTRLTTGRHYAPAWRP